MESNRSRGNYDLRSRPKRSFGLRLVGLEPLPLGPIKLWAVWCMIPGCHPPSVLCCLVLLQARHVPSRGTCTLTPSILIFFVLHLPPHPHPEIDGCPRSVLTYIDPTRGYVNLALNNEVLCVEDIER